MGRWKTAVIEEIHRLSPTTKRFILNIESEETFAFKAGQFITLDLPIGEKRLDRWRSYSISSAPSEDNRIELCIVEVEDGRASKYLFHDVATSWNKYFEALPSSTSTIQSSILLSSDGAEDIE